jgi:hypothetical protein
MAKDCITAYNSKTSQIKSVGWRLEFGQAAAVSVHLNWEPGSELLCNYCTRAAAPYTTLKSLQNMYLTLFFPFSLRQMVFGFGKKNKDSGTIIYRENLDVITNPPYDSLRNPTQPTEPTQANQ